MSESGDSEARTEPEILFYHLERARLQDVLPTLLERSLQRGWRAVIEAPDRKVVDKLNSHLWSYREDSFLPHGAPDDGFADRQPIYLANSSENPNGAAIRFFVGGAEPQDIAGYERIVYLFNGFNDDELTRARRQWKRLTSEGRKATYWRQNEQGSWEKRA